MRQGLMGILECAPNPLGPVSEQERTPWLHIDFETHLQRRHEIAPMLGASADEIALVAAVSVGIAPIRGDDRRG